jgi:hypothetical protein
MTRRDSTVTTFACKVCGSEFRAPLWKKQKYCSHPCSVKYGLTEPPEDRFFTKVQFVDKWYDNGVVRTRCMEWRETQRAVMAGSMLLLDAMWRPIVGFTNAGLAQSLRGWRSTISA